MRASLLNFGGLMLTWLIHAAWQAGLLALVVLAVTWLLGRRLHPGWRYALWLVVFVRLAVPVLPESRFSVFHIASVVVVPQATFMVESLSTTSRSRMDRQKPLPLDNSRDVELTATLRPQIIGQLTGWPLNGNASEQTSKSGSWSLTTLAVFIWLAGIGILLWRFSANLLRLNRQQSEWRLITDPDVLCLLQTCQLELKLSRQVNVYASNNLGPATCGIFRPRVVVPQRLLERLSLKELRLVLLHELVHIRRHDVLTDQLIAIVTIVHWFHPVAWFSRFMLRSERELACDATVLEQTHAANPSDYGHLILKTIESLHAPFPPMAGLVGIFSRRPQSLVDRRIRLIADYRRATWTHLWLGAVPLFVLGFIGLTVPACNVQTAEHTKIVVTRPEAKSVTITEQYVSQIQSQRHIKVRAFQRGYLESIPVKEGQQVKEGDLMFSVMPVLYQGRLDVEAAEAKIAQLEYDYTKKNYDDKVVSSNELAIVEAKLQKARAKVQQAQAELNFASMRAPFDGIVGRLSHQQGSLVEEGEDLTTLSDNSFLSVYFNVPEARYLKYMAGPTPHQEDLKIELVLANGNKFPQVGKIGAIQSEFNNATGSISFIADFPNPDRLLRPGQTGTVLISKLVKDAIVIPQRATFEILSKRYIYVVDEKDVVHQREIEVQNELEDIFVIKNGVGVDDKIVLDGFRQFRDGDKVQYENR